MNYATCPFTFDELQSAHYDWGCNCGPAALAVVLNITLDEARIALPEFADRRYVNPRMMIAALNQLAPAFMTIKPTLAAMFHPQIALVRVQFTGPWTTPGANPKWAYRHTHWIATWRRDEGFVFDLNRGITSFERWDRETVNQITATIKRADGQWFPTHIFRICRHEFKSRAKPASNQEL